MDNLTVDLGDRPDAGALRGATAVLIGADPTAGRITAEDLAARLGTINYEITCGLTSRVDRVYHRDGVPAPERQATGQAASQAPSHAPSRAAWPSQA
jgi:alanine racemase